jgi:hypothetical protein
MNVYNCFDQIFVEEYLFDSPVSQCSTVETYRGLIIRLTFENGLIKYFCVKDIHEENRFCLLTTIFFSISGSMFFILKVNHISIFIISIARIIKDVALDVKFHFEHLIEMHH